MAPRLTSFGLLGRGRAKRGMFEGDLQEGELEIGQIAAMLDSLEPAADPGAGVWLKSVALWAGRLGWAV